jgi:serine kinase of HPr protein (carbohydrate metabolism regulator)
VNIHASCVVLGRAGEPFGGPADAGVLLLGESGSGKSDLALRLIQFGAMLLSDDRTELSVADGVLMARPVASLSGLLEVRGLGILELPHRQQARVVLAVRLVAPGDISRLPAAEWYDPPAGLIVADRMRPPLMSVAASENSAPAKIAAAVAAHAKALFRDGRKAS